MNNFRGDARARCVLQKQLANDSSNVQRTVIENPNARAVVMPQLELICRRVLISWRDA